jgi:hypothetical protein
MNSRLLDTEFTVVDEIRVNHQWAAQYPEMKGLCDGKLLVLGPPCAGEIEVEGLSAVATTPQGVEVALGFDKVIVNKGGCIGLFFAGIFTRTVPKGTTVRFGKVSEEGAEDDAQYVPQGILDVPEADRILPRLEKEGIRFEIDTDVSTHPSGKCGVWDGRIALFVHMEDVAAWEKIRAEYFPV